MHFSARQVSLWSSPSQPAMIRETQCWPGQEKHFRPWAGFTLEHGYRISHLCEEKEMNREHYYPTYSSPRFSPSNVSLYLITTKWGYVSFALKQLFYNSNKMFYISLIMVSHLLTVSAASARGLGKWQVVPVEPANLSSAGITASCQRVHLILKT